MKRFNSEERFKSVISSATRHRMAIINASLTLLVVNQTGILAQSSGCPASNACPTNSATCTAMLVTSYYLCENRPSPYNDCCEWLKKIWRYAGTLCPEKCGEYDDSGSSSPGSPGYGFLYTGGCSGTSQTGVVTNGTCGGNPE